MYGQEGYCNSYAEVITYNGVNIICEIPKQGPATWMISN